MAKQTVQIEVPDGWEIVGFRSVQPGEHWYDGASIRQWKQSFNSEPYAVVVRQAHVWLEAVLQYARRFELPWAVVGSSGDAFLCWTEPEEGDGDWRFEAIDPVPIQWMPPHDYRGEGWRKCKWRLPV